MTGHRMHLAVMGAAALVALVLALTGSTSLVPVLLIALCPIMMMLMMGGHGHDHDGRTHRDDEVPQERHGHSHC